MGNYFTGIVFLLVGVAVYAYNTESHQQQVIFPGLTPDQTAAALLGLGVFFTAVGGFRWLRARRAARELRQFEEQADVEAGQEGP